MTSAMHTIKQARIQRCRTWVKHSKHPLAQCIFNTVQTARQFELPMPRAFASGLYYAYRFITNTVNSILRAVLFTPMFKSRLQACGTALYLYGGMPYLAGPLQIHIGNRCRISGKTTITGRSTHYSTPVLNIGNNVDIGWQTTIAVGASIYIGNNARIAGQCFLAGYPGHPLAARARAEGKPELDQQALPIHIADDVWLGSGVTVLAGVSIGEGSVIGAGSVVTKSLPAGVIAAGNPARVIRKIDEAKA